MLMEEVNCLPQYFGSCYLIEIMTLLRISPVDNFGVTAACIATKYGCIAHVNEIIFPPMLNEQELEPTPIQYEANWKSPAKLASHGNTRIFGRQGYREIAP